MNPILFLDFDGVLHPASAYQTRAFCHAPALAECLQPYACDLVISSSWRFNYSLDELRNLLPSALAHRVIGMTGPAHIGRYARHHEILAFLQGSGDFPTGSWRAMDDAKWEFPAGLRNLVSCDPNTGLAATQLQDLKKWLGRPQDIPKRTTTKS